MSEPQPSWQSDDLLPLQRSVLIAIRSYSERSGIAPTLREISDICGLSGPSAALIIVNQLAALNVIHRMPGIARGIRVVRGER